ISETIRNSVKSISRHVARGSADAASAAKARILLITVLMLASFCSLLSSTSIVECIEIFLECVGRRGSARKSASVEYRQTCVVCTIHRETSAVLRCIQQVIGEKLIVLSQQLDEPRQVQRV